uniref:Uncharacterized protein n=1 Tax=viral metagenome TaxID=1070528 RepID=A0A6C0DVG5_9ZZZZ
MTCIINYPHGKSINIPQINIDKWYSENGDNNVFIVNKIYLGRKIVFGSGMLYNFLWRD